nr:uncharacterized protein LOC125418900 [Ziziphus jujuba var. spinosa]
MVDNIKIMLFSSSTDNIEDLMRFIFENGEKLHGKKIDWSWQFFGQHWMKFTELDNEFRYTEEVLRLHLCTEICYHQTETESSKYTEERKRSRRICKVISDYMFYLLIMKPEILGPSVMGINGQNTFHKTFEKAKRYLIKNQVLDHIKACNELIDYHEKEKDWSETVLSFACLRAQSLLEQENDYWKDLSYEWLLGLCFGALRNRPMLQAEQASKDGELLTFIWVLLHHLVEDEKLGGEEDW